MKLSAAALLALSMTAIAACAPPAREAAEAPPTPAEQAQAGTMQGGMPGMSDGQAMTPEMMRMHGGPAGPDYMAAMSRMEQRMTAAQDADPARQWALMMIPHHQGAVDTARIALRNTQDGELRAIAQRTIDAQERDIAELQAWLARTPDPG